MVLQSLKLTSTKIKILSEEPCIYYKTILLYELYMTNLLTGRCAMQNRVGLALPSIPRQIHVPLSSAQRAVADWAMVDDYEAVLDMDCGNGALLAHFLKRFHLRACGIINQAGYQNTDALALIGQDAEILRASKLDIPWRSESFDAVFITTPLHRHPDTATYIKEIHRVLKPWGRVLAAVPCIPLLMRLGINAAKSLDSVFFDAPRVLMELLEENGFSDVSMRCSRFQFATVIGQKEVHHVSGAVNSAKVS